jgi:hypothetical protein
MNVISRALVSGPTTPVPSLVGWPLCLRIGVTRGGIFACILARNLGAAARLGLSTSRGLHARSARSVALVLTMSHGRGGSAVCPAIMHAGISAGLAICLRCRKTGGTGQKNKQRAG